MRRRVLTRTMAVALALAGAAACDGDGDGDGDSDRSSDQSNVDVDVGDDVPGDFPADAVPLPDESIASSSALGSGGERSWTLVYQVDDVSQAANGYLDRLESAGFAIEETFSTGDEQGDLESFTATGEEYIVTAFAGGISGESVLSVTVSPALVDEL
jgi:hypothetical protein